MITDYGFILIIKIPLIVACQIQAGEDEKWDALKSASQIVLVWTIAFSYLTPSLN